MKKLALGPVPKGSKPEDWLCAGPFCFAGQEEDFPNWEKRFTFAPEPLSDPHTLALAAKCAQALCVGVIPSLADSLELVPKGHKLIYWQILLCPWSMDLARQMIERAFRCQAMCQAWGEQYLKVPLLPENCSFHFLTEHDFTLRGNFGAKFNHWLFSRILENMWPVRWKKEYLPEYDDQKERGDIKKISFAQLKERIRHYLLYMSFPRLKGMTLAQAALFSNALRKPLKNVPQAEDLEKTYYNEDLLRQVTLPENYEKIFARFIPESIRALKHEGKAGKPVKSARLRAVSPVAYEDAAYRQNLALWREMGNALAWVQHGGNYGQVRTSCEAEVIEYSQAFFFTWGWDKYENVHGRFVPLPYPQLAKLANAWQGKKEEIIFVGAEMAAYGYRLDSHPSPMQYIEYRQWKADFLNALPSEFRKKIFYRPYFSNPGTLADAPWLLQRFPELQLSEGELMPRILNCRLLVLDHHGTTLLEAMAANVPMLLYWNREHWQLTKSCEDLLDKLEACGIWHRSPESAAKKLNEIWPNTEKWWKTPEITEARKHFCQQYARLPQGNLNKTWIEALQDL